MKEKDIHKLIEAQNPEVKERIWQRIQAELPEYASAKPVAKPKINVKKWVALAVTLLCVITLSIVLPLTLGPKDDVNAPPINTDNNPPQNENRYCTNKQYTSEDLGQTLREYSTDKNLKLLYVDWYAVGEELVTKYGYMLDDSSDIVYFEEFIMNGETGEAVTLYITNNKTRVDKFDKYYKCKDEFVVNNCVVKWSDANSEGTIAMFEYENYTYYLNLDTPNAPERLQEIIQDMFN